MIIHPFKPCFDNNSKILILGTFPSVKSREDGFYYGHPQNRFWRMVAEVTGDDVPKSVEEKKKLLLNNNIALWDVLKSCEITGSSDSSIRNEVPNDIKELISQTCIRAVFFNGNTAFRLFKKHIGTLDLPFYILPSTSPANASKKLSELIQDWMVIKQYL